MCSGEELPVCAAEPVSGESAAGAAVQSVRADRGGGRCDLLGVHAQDARAERVPIGRPICEHADVCVGSTRQPVPIGVAGEMYIGGVGVARGYLNRPELTAERFMPIRSVSDPGARLYRTGIWAVSGGWELEYLGRNDTGEDPGLSHRAGRDRGAAGAAPAGEGGGGAGAGGRARARSAWWRMWCAQARESVAPERRGAARASEGSAAGVHGAERVCACWSSLPLTPNGKLDRRALPAPEQGAYVSRQYEAPQGEVEEILAGIWQELLRVERVGRQDNFFELGGHSLLIVQMMERLRRVGSVGGGPAGL